MIQVVRWLSEFTPPDHDITSLEIRPGDGRISYGTKADRIFTVSQDGQSNLLYDAGHATGKAFEIGSLNWSPNGEHLAFTMHFKSGDWASQEGGLWLMEEGGQVPVKLLDNHYRDSELDDVAEVRMIRDVDWSPDGSALLLEIGFWEHQDTLWLKPLIPDPNEANLIDLPGVSTDGTWASDSRSVLLSGLNRGVFSNMDRAINQIQQALSDYWTGMKQSWRY